MALKDDFKYAIVDGIDRTFEEHKETFGAVRKVAWGDNTEGRLEIRRWRNNADGTEFAGKGYTFMSEDGPGELCKTLLDLGYGRTKDILESIKDREDFRKSLNSVLGKDDDLYDKNEGTLEDDFYDPSALVGGL